MYSEM